MFKFESKKTDDIFKLTEDLLHNFRDLNSFLLDDEKDISPTYVLESVINFFLDGICKRNSTYKRNMFDASNELYVHPEERAVGVRWELKKIVKEICEKISIPQYVQNTYQYIPVHKTIHSLFKSAEFRDVYF